MAGVKFSGLMLYSGPSAAPILELVATFERVKWWLSSVR